LKMTFSPQMDWFSRHLFYTSWSVSFLTSSCFLCLIQRAPACTLGTFWRLWYRGFQSAAISNRHCQRSPSASENVHTKHVHVSFNLNKWLGLTSMCHRDDSCSSRDDQSELHSFRLHSTALLESCMVKILETLF